MVINFIKDENGVDVLDSWNVSDTYPIPNVGDWVTINDFFNHEVVRRCFNKQTVRLFVS